MTFGNGVEAARRRARARDTRDGLSLSVECGILDSARVTRMDRVFVAHEVNNGIRIQDVRLIAAGSLGRVALASDSFHPGSLSLFVY